MRQEVEDVIGLDASDAVLASAKAGIGIEDILEQIVEKVPAPAGDPEAPLKALIFDSWFDSYRGVITLIRIFDGTLRPGTKVQLMSTGAVHEVEEVGYLTPKAAKVGQLSAGEVGYCMAGIKDLSRARVGDTITEKNRPTHRPLEGFREAKPMVFCGMYPLGPSSVEDLRRALEKLRLNDFSFHYEPENSPALGLGFRCGFPHSG